MDVTTVYADGRQRLLRSRLPAEPPGEWLAAPYIYMDGFVQYIHNWVRGCMHGLP